MRQEPNEIERYPLSSAYLRERSAILADKGDDLLRQWIVYVPEWLEKTDHLWFETRDDAVEYADDRGIGLNNWVWIVCPGRELEANETTDFVERSFDAY